MRRWWPLPLAAVVAGAIYLFAGSTQGTSTHPSYVTAAVDRGRITAVVTATGTVNPTTSVQVGTYVSGPIKAIYADYNTPIEKGQLLAKIDPAPFEVKVDAARAELANARAKLTKSQADAKLKAVTLDRQRALRTGGVVSHNELDQAESEEQQAEAQVALDAAAIQSAEARLREAEVNLAYTDIVSPIDGVVVARSVATGQTVAASFQTPTLFLVAGDLTKMSVSASVSEADIGGIINGQPVAFTVDAYPGVPFEGKVIQVRSAPVTVQNVVTYEVIAAVANPDMRLKPGMTANVTIVVAERPDALRVPTSALRFKPPGQATPTAAGPRVWTPGDDGTPRAIAVTTGIADDTYTEVTGGLEAATTVITALRREETTPTTASRPPSFPGAGGGGRRNR